MDPGTEGMRLIDKVRAALVPHELPAVTDKVTEVLPVPKFAVMALVPCPEATVPAVDEKDHV